MSRHSERREIGNKWNENDVTNYLKSRLKLIIEKANKTNVVHSSLGFYEISDGYNSVPVDLHSKTCTCRRWQISGYPCKHAYKALQCYGGRLTDFVNECYTVKTYRTQYELNILPVPDELYWSTGNYPKILPPVIERQVGRPARNRRKEEGERSRNNRSRSLMCSKCHNHGHNRRSCQGGLTAKESKEQAASTSAPCPRAPPQPSNQKGKATAKEKGKATDKGKGKAPASDGQSTSKRRRQGNIIISG